MKRRMKKYPMSLSAALAAILALILGAGVPAVAGEDEEDSFEEASLYLELNHTDGDLGLHGLIDGDAWKVLVIKAPGARENLKITTQGSMRKHGLTELFFESAEPRFPDEITLSEFFRRFPAGEWEIEARTIEGEELEGTVELSHVLAAPPGNVEVGGYRDEVGTDESLRRLVKRLIDGGAKQKTLAEAMELEDSTLTRWLRGDAPELRLSALDGMRRYLREHHPTLPVLLGDNLGPSQDAEDLLRLFAALPQAEQRALIRWLEVRVGESSPGPAPEERPEPPTTGTKTP